jgi:hypothetical protein
MAMVTAKLYWLRMVLKDLQISITAPPLLWCDNLGAIALASNPVYHARTKHIEVDYHFIREKILNKDISLSFISTCDHPTNTFTKGLTSSRFLFLRDKLMVCPPPIRLRGMLTNMISYTYLHLFLIQIQIQVHIYLQSYSFIKIGYTLLFRILSCKLSLGLLSKLSNVHLCISIQYSWFG